MAFPRETEEQIRRTVLEICQDQIRRVLGVVRELTNMVSDFAEKTYAEMPNHLERIKTLKSEAAEQKRILLQELAETGMLLLNREDFLRLAVQLAEIVDFSEGAAYRITYITERQLEVANELREYLFNMSKNVLKTVTNLRETILSLAYSRSRAIDMAKNVEIAEYAVDEIFREIEVLILDAGMNLQTTLILRDLAQFLESIADKAEDAIDSTRILALGV